MNPYHREVLKSNLNLLMTSVNYDAIAPLLVDYGLYTKAMTEDIERENNKLLSLLQSLPTRGPKAFESFVQLLRDTGQSHAADIIDSVNLNNSSESHSVSARNVIGEPASITATVVKAKFAKEGPQIYRMLSVPRGLCLIINNINFEESPREGAVIDSIKADETFRQLNFKVTLRQNLNAQAMLNELQVFSRRQQHEDCDAAVVVIMSHGAENVVYGLDMKQLSIQAMLDLFNNANCIHLRGKPKMFFIQACRGVKDDTGVEDVIADASTYFVAEAGNAKSICSRRTVEDILIVQAAAPGYTAMRNRLEGSWLMGTLVEVLMENACKDHLLDMMNEVDRRIKKKMGNGGQRQTTSITNHGFNKHLYFNPL